jgi:hypothetical protein
MQHGLSQFLNGYCLRQLYRFALGNGPVLAAKAHLLSPFELPLQLLIQLPQRVIAIVTRYWGPLLRPPLLLLPATNRLSLANGALLLDLWGEDD